MSPLHHQWLFDGFISMRLINNWCLFNWLTEFLRRMPHWVAGVVCSETPPWRSWLFVAILTSDPRRQLGIFSSIQLPTHRTIFSLFSTVLCELQQWTFQHTTVPHSFFPLWCWLWPSGGRPHQWPAAVWLADYLPQTYKRVNFIPAKAAGEY